MKRILIISGIQIWPAQSGGHWRSLNLARTLAKQGYAVTIYSLTGRKADYRAKVPSSANVIGEGIVEHVNRGRLRGALQFLTYRLGMPDLWHALPLPLPALLRKSIASHETIVIDFPFLRHYWRRLSGKLRILHSHNVESDRWRGTSWPLIVRHEERAAGREADIVLAASQTEKYFFQSLPESHCNVLLLPNRVSGERFISKVGERTQVRRELGVLEDSLVCLFTGSRYAPNLEALQILKQFEEKNRAWLAVRRITLVVVGSVSEPFRAGQLIATGSVDSVERYFTAADAALNLVHSGSGTNVKMAEYLMARLPVLSTEFGARGLKLDAGHDFIAISDLKSALETLADLSHDERRAMADRALEKNRFHIDSDAIADSMREALETALTPHAS
ncbi:MAG: glycosyltransferase [Deltaproteobacteria bacterium]|nr:glycosyltransferase [Deltaproteobacteria bacterium]MBI3295063.1 glycosyltransferase [Deltaproteobacteria bacterium]